MPKRSNAQWKTLVHNGVLFPQPYKALPSNVKVVYNKNPLQLNEEQEEAICLFVRTSELDNVATKNFFHDWRALLGKEMAKIVQKWDLLDLSNVKAYLQSSTSQKVSTPPEVMEKYRTCQVDGNTQPVANFIVEPPAIFKGRGDHPLRGKIKARVKPEDVTLNISKGVPIPKPNVPGQWGAVINDKHAFWIASWRQNVTGKIHYVYLGQDSDQRMIQDQQKFDVARKLNKNISKIRKQITKDIDSKDTKLQQLATALWIIDNLAIRVGNEKSDDEAQTVGVTGLLLQHVKVTDGKLYLNFLGKDSIPYSRSVQLPSTVSHNISTFIKNKSSKDKLFDLIDSKDVNDYLQNLMSGLSAKVFRTMNSSVLFQQKLQEAATKLKKAGCKVADVYREYTLSTVSVAELMNHQKMVTSNDLDTKKLDERIKAAKDNPKKLKELREMKRLRKAKKNLNLGTSRTNYLDPRITVVFAKQMGVPIEKFFSATLMKKFKWALDVEVRWVF